MTHPRRPGSVRARVSYGIISEKEKKASICVGDELHYVSVLNSNWRLALWRYLPCAESVKRNNLSTCFENNTTLYFDFLLTFSNVTT